MPSSLLIRCRYRSSLNALFALVVFDRRVPAVGVVVVNSLFHVGAGQCVVFINGPGVRGCCRRGCRHGCRHRCCSRRGCGNGLRCWGRLVATGSCKDRNGDRDHKQEEYSHAGWCSPVFQSRPILPHIALLLGSQNQPSPECTAGLSPVGCRRCRNVSKSGAFRYQPVPLKARGRHEVQYWPDDKCRPILAISSAFECSCPARSAWSCGHPASLNISVMGDIYRPRSHRSQHDPADPRTAAFGPRPLHSSKLPHSLIDGLRFGARCGRTPHAGRLGGGFHPAPGCLGPARRLPPPDLLAGFRREPAEIAEGDRRSVSRYVGQSSRRRGL